MLVSTGGDEREKASVSQDRLNGHSHSLCQPSPSIIVT